jgi:hypothetical protein
MSLTDKINIVIRNAARDCAFKCTKKIPKELDMFLLAAHQVKNADSVFLSNWPDTWGDQDDEIINATMWYALELYNDHYAPDNNLMEDEEAIQKQFIKFYNIVFKQARSIAVYFDQSFNPVVDMMLNIAKATGAKKSEASEAPYNEVYFDGFTSPYTEFAKQVFKYLEPKLN